MLRLHCNKDGERALNWIQIIALSDAARHKPGSYAANSENGSVKARISWIVVNFV